MSQELYACVYAKEFPAQALLRLHPELASQPVAVLDGCPPLQTVCSLNRAAHLKGASAGMTRLEAESLSELHLVTRSMETESAARTVLFEYVAQFSPRIEEVSQGTECSCVLDIAGTERLFGPPQTLARNLRAALATAGFHVSIAVSTNFHTARIKAKATRGITVIPHKQETVALGKLPLTVLDLPEDPAITFGLWGIRTLAQLADLPEVELVTRLGPQAVDWRKLACGKLPHAFQPIEAEFALQEFCAFETPIEQIDSLLFMGARMIECLATRAATRALALASLAVTMQLDGGVVYQRTIRPALATIDRKFLLKLLQLEIAAHPPPSAVLSLTLGAQAGQSSKVQLGLFAPQIPEPSRLDVTIARLKAIAGEDRVGAPVLEDTHRPGSFRTENFSIAEPSSAGQHKAIVANPARMALRRVRPPTSLRVQLDALRPIAFRDREQSFKVTSSYGPWRTSGCWWSTEAWNTEEWDVLAESSGGSSIACLLVHDCTHNQWQLEAFYD
jgi:protein ImuB